MSTRASKPKASKKPRAPEKKQSASTLEADKRRAQTLKRLLRAYGPILIIVVAFILMALLVPTLDRPAP